MNQFDLTAASSMAEVIGRHTGGVTLVDHTELEGWLPALPAPPGWAQVNIDGVAATRMLMRRSDTHRWWDGCEVLNLYRFAGTVPEELVRNNADRTLRDCGSVGALSYTVSMPRESGTIAVRASGNLQLGARQVSGLFSHYVVHTAAAGGALIEQTILIGDDAVSLLAREVGQLTEGLRDALLSSIASAGSAIDNQ